MKVNGLKSLKKKKKMGWWRCGDGREVDLVTE